MKALNLVFLAYRQAIRRSGRDDTDAPCGGQSQLELGAKLTEKKSKKSMAHV